MGSQLAEQIAQLKQQMAFGMKLGTQGKAGGGWGLGSTPYAVTPAPAPNSKPDEKRQGDKSLKDTKPTDFEPLYAPEDFANSTYDAHVKGQLDLSHAPEKVEEIQTAPETQQALSQYSNIVSAYVDSEESAIQHEKVPLEYQDLVKQYFEELQKGAKSDSKAPAKDNGSAAKKSKKK